MNEETECSKCGKEQLKCRNCEKVGCVTEFKPTAEKCTNALFTECDIEKAKNPNTENPDWQTFKFVRCECGNPVSFKKEISN